MPSTKPLPTVNDFRQEAIDAVRSLAFNRADQHTGARYDYIFGTSAILWSREVQYVRDVFRAIYIDSADGDDLTNRLKRLWDEDRILDTYGIGYATFQRANATAGQETFHEGTRLRVGSTSYCVAEETTTIGTATYAVVKIRATTVGPGVATNTSAAIIDDALNDPSWNCVGLNCGDGTRFELADAFRGRGRAARLDARVGYTKAIIAACQGAGASNVAAFPSNFAGNTNDPGYSAVYVADDNFGGTSDLVYNTILALEKVRVLGAETHVGLMVSTTLAINATVYLWDDPGQFDVSQLANAASNAILSLFGGSTKGFMVNRDALTAAIMNTTNAVQWADFASPSMDLGIMTGTPLVFPQVLPRYRVTPQSISLTFAGPQ